MSIWTAVNYHLRNEMAFNEGYKLDEMYEFYIKTMKADNLCELRVVKIDSLRKHLEQWCEVEDGWLQCDGSGQMARYSKKHPACPFVIMRDYIRRKLWNR